MINTINMQIMMKNSKQQQTTKITDTTNTMQNEARSEKRKGEVVWCARLESAEGWYASYGVRDGVGE